MIITILTAEGQYHTIHVEINPWFQEPPLIREAVEQGYLADLHMTLTVDAIHRNCAIIRDSMP